VPELLDGIEIVLVAVGLFAARHLLVDPVGPLLPAIAGANVAALVLFARTRRMRQAIERKFARYVSPEVVRRLAKLSMNVAFSGRSRWGRSRAPFLWSKRKRAPHAHRVSIAASGRIQSPAPSLVQQRHVVGSLHAPLWWPQAAGATVARDAGVRRGGSEAG
jgi:hypothetical protein